MSITSERLRFDEELLDIIKENSEAGNIEFYYAMKNKNLHKLLDNDGNTLLHFASKYHNIELIQDLINAGSEINTQNSEGKTPIILAIENRSFMIRDLQLRTVKTLCESNANIFIKDKYGRSAASLVFGNLNSTDKPMRKLFFDVIQKQCMNDDEVIAENLLSVGCSLQQAIFSKNSNLIEHMIKKGCLVNGKHGSQTALHVAVSFMDLGCVEVLVKHGADVNITDNNGYIPLGYYGCFLRPNEKQYPEIVQLLLSKIVVPNSNNMERFLAFQTRNILQFGNKKAIQILLEFNNNALYVIANSSQTPLHFLARNFNSDIVEVLQSQNYYVNLKDYKGNTPLHCAASHYCGHVGIFKCLLENNANVNAKNKKEHTPLFLLCKNTVILKKMYFKIIQLFIQYGLDIQIYGPNEMTVFDIILENKLFYKAKPLLAHLAILEEQDHLKEHIRRKINSHSMLKNYFNLCKYKLKKMKLTSINRQLTLFSFLVEQDEKIVKSCKLDQNALFKLKRLTKKRSSYYHNIVRKRISRIVTKLELRIQSRSITCNLLRIIDDPNHVVVTEIINYLSDDDMKNLCRISNM